LPRHRAEIGRRSANHQVLILPDQVSRSEYSRVGTIVAPHRTGDIDMAIRKLAALAAAAAFLASAPAFATQPERSSTTVRYADLNLSTPAGVKMLRHRVASALESVCGSYAGTDTAGAEGEADTIAKCRAANRVLVDRRVAALVSANVQVAAAR
jgi:UrcA family protein